MTEPSTLPSYLRLPADVHPEPDPANVLQGEHWRITLLDAGLVRLEWSPSGRFADQASQAFWHRDAAPVEHTVRESGDLLEVVTDRLHLTYDRQEFTPQGLSVQALGGVSNYHSVWRYGGQGEGNLGGTARTLDGVDGACPLEDGILAIHGVAAVDDSDSVLLDENGCPTPREPASVDVYVFAYGRDYRAALASLYRVAGPQPLLPRFALGNWWSRYHPYTADEYIALMDRFAAEDLPFTVAVLDMDWHWVDIDPRFGSGWTGYTWNTDLFPDPPAFLAGLHERGLRTTLNVHPADGVAAHEEAYAAMAEAMGVDPAAELPVPFDPTDPRFMAAYLRVLHHPREAEGVDFWWLDWQSGPISRMRGLDPLWLLNHLHFLDSGRPGGPLEGRPLTFSRYAGVGSHRYPVGFSGDTVVSWASLAFQPEFTARASNVGYGWWSHDIGGHMFGGKDDELIARWTQLGVFSPILRLHSTADPFNSKEPWRFGEVARRVMGEALRLRHRLLPYLATMARRAHVDGLPLVAPMYHEHPWAAEAYEVDHQFLFGDLVVAPVTSPVIRPLGLARVRTWLPEGRWVDLLSGTAYAGGRMVPMYRPIDALPVLAREGTPLPLLPEDSSGNDTAPPDALEIWLVPGADGSFTLWEDRDDDRWASTTLSYDADEGTFRIAAADGDLATLPSERAWTLVVYAGGPPPRATVGGAALAVTTGAIRGSVRVDLGRHPVDRDLVVTLDPPPRPANADRDARIFDLLDAAQIGYQLKSRVLRAATSGDPAQAALWLQGLDLDPNLLGAVSELLLA